MPNYDAGHYFLTVIAPIRTDPVWQGERCLSRRFILKDLLARMPTGEITVATRELAQAAGGFDPPFARCTRTHFARFVVLDDLTFNGRVSGDTLLHLLSTIRSGSDPVAAQPVDTLASQYLIFAADFDAPAGGDSALQSYAGDLWSTMQTELVSIFQHCDGFDASDAGGFFRYLKQCQVETTLPFNDYWAPPPSPQVNLPSFPVIPYVAVIGVAAVAAIITLVTARFGWFALASAITVLGLFAMAWNMIAFANQPWPTTAPPDPQPSLPSVLKALYLQRAFTAFAIDAQALRLGREPDAALHAAFGDFIGRVRPDDLAEPTQPPAVLGT